MTHDPLSDHSKKKAAVEPGVKDSAVRCDRVAFFKEEGELIFCGT